MSNPLYSAGIIDSTFLGVFSLGTRSYTLPIIAFIVYAIQTKLSIKMMPQPTQPGQEQMQNQMQMMQWLSPIMIAGDIHCIICICSAPGCPGCTVCGIIFILNFVWIA